MRVLEARHHHPAIEVIDLRPVTDERIDACVVADIHDAAVVDGDRFGPLAVRVDRVDAAAAVDSVGGARIRRAEFDDARFNDVVDVLQHGDVRERITLDGNEVAVAADGECADIVRHAHVFGSDRRCRTYRVHRAHAARNHDLELACIQAVRIDRRIGAVNDRYTGCVGFLEDLPLCFGRLVVLAHEFCGIAERLADLGRVGAVVDVHRERHAALGGECDGFVIGERRMFYRIDARIDGVLDRLGAVSMCRHSHASCMCDVDDSLDFFQRHFRRAGNPTECKHCAGCDDLDHVGTGIDGLPRFLGELLRTASDTEPHFRRNTALVFARNDEVAAAGRNGQVWTGILDTRALHFAIQLAKFHIVND